MGGPVAIDKMEKVQLRNKAGRIHTFRPMEVPEPGGATGTDMEDTGYRILDVHGNVS